MKKHKKRKSNALLYLFVLIYFISCNNGREKLNAPFSDEINYISKISILDNKDTRIFAMTGDTFPLRVRNAYELLFKEQKVQGILADTLRHKRRLLIHNYPNIDKPFYEIGIREFIGGQGFLLYSFSVDANNGNIFFRPKPFSDEHNAGNWKIPINEWVF